MLYPEIKTPEVQLPRFPNKIRAFLRKEKVFRRKPPELKSALSIWDSLKLARRFAQGEYSIEEIRKLLKHDAQHFAKEVGLVETITRFSYLHEVSSEETRGDGYKESISAMLRAFTQELAEKGLNSSRAVVEAVTFQRAKTILTKIAEENSSQAVVITSFPDDKESGYHGVDSKYNWNKPETHHSFFYLLRVGKTKRDKNGKITNFEIKVTQYRLWPNAQQALEIHQRLGQPITSFDAPIPNLLFANLIVVNQQQLEKLSQQAKNSPQDPKEDDFERAFKMFLFQRAQEHKINYLNTPEIDETEFWRIHQKYFEDFYLAVAVPVFKEIIELFNKYSEPDRATLKEIQEKIDYLDKAFQYYYKVLMGWIRNNNTNPHYQQAFKDKGLLNTLIGFQQKLLLKLLGYKPSETLPSVTELKRALEIDSKLSAGKTVSTTEKKQLLGVWGFFSSIGEFSSLLQCGTMAPFTIPLGIMSQSGELGKSITLFSASISNLTLPEQKLLLESIRQEDYVELDLTKNSPPAEKVYMVPRSYLLGIGCIVDNNGRVLGPCIDPTTGQRIPLDDPRDTLAFPMNKKEFQQYLSTLEEKLRENSIEQIQEIIENTDLPQEQKNKARQAIKRLSQWLIKQTLGLQDFITGIEIKRANSVKSDWLEELSLKLSFSLNPVQLLTEEVNKMIQERDPRFKELMFSEN